MEEPDALRGGETPLKAASYWSADETWDFRINYFKKSQRNTTFNKQLRDTARCQNCFIRIFGMAIFYNKSINMLHFLEDLIFLYANTSLTCVKCKLMITNLYKIIKKLRVAFLAVYSVMVC